MSFWSEYSKYKSRRPSWENFYNSTKPFWDKAFGYTQMKNTQDSLSAQIAYDQYLAEGNKRALADWHRNVPGREIRYPEFSYPGQIVRADTSVARAGLDYSTAGSNYVGNLPYRGSGLYGIGSRLFRRL